MMTANHTLFEKDGVFGFHVGACHLELVAVAEDFIQHRYTIDRSLSTLRTYHVQYALGVALYLHPYLAHILY